VIEPDHPDFEPERTRLAETITVLDRQIEEFTVSMPSRKDWTLHQLWRMWSRNRQRLEEVRGQPYFGRIDFAEGGGAAPEAYYVGRVGAPGITDWRAPIASLFYEASGGQTRYIAPGGPVHGFLSLRRQYHIESGALLALYDTLLRDQITRSVLGYGQEDWTDEYLIKELGRTSGERLKDIIATIQSEQNQVIRAPLDKIVVVQGVAGSGKTTVALHRVSYLLYTYPVQVRPERVLVLAPNRLFLQYIEELLPQTLGAMGVAQDTVRSWLLRSAGVKAVTADPSPLSGFLRSKDAPAVLGAWVARHVDSRLLPDEDLCFSAFHSICRSQIRQWFHEDYALWPIMTRIERIRRRLTGERERYLERVRELLYREEPERPAESQSRSRLRAGPGRRDATNRLSMVERAARLKVAEKQSQEALDIYLKFFPRSDVHLHAWQQFVAGWGTAQPHGRPGQETQEESTSTDAPGLPRQGARARRSVAEEELPALAYMHDALFGIPESEKRDHIVVDEAQELTPLLCAVLMSRCRTPSMTLVGDLAQAISSTAPSSNWREVLGDQASDETLAEFTFDKSYRSTCEIVALARSALERAGENVPLPEPVMRHGLEPQVSGYRAFDEMMDAIVQAFDEMATRVRTIAVITPTAGEAARTHEALATRGVNLCLLAGTDSSRSGAGVVAPVEVVRGLEFDGVIVSGASRDSYPATSNGARRLYVALTRALHEIAVVWAGEPSPLISGKA
jgi:DNA helicase-2/ATP-dependent DNA helicase PcrA